MNFFKIFFIKIIIFVIFFVSNLNASNTTKIVAKIGSEIITSFELENKIKTTLFLSNFELNQKNIDEVKNISLVSLIDLKLKKEELKRFNIKQNVDDRINNHLKNVSIRKNISPLILKDEFENNQIDYNQYIDEIKTEFLWQNLIFSLYKKKISLDENQIVNELNQAISRERHIQEFRLAEIEVEKMSSNDKQFENEIQNYIREKGFEEAVLKFSIATSAEKKGDIGWINSTTLSDKVLNAIKDLKIGEVSKPLRNSQSIIFLKLVNKRKILDKTKMNMEELKTQIINKQTNDLLEMFSNNHLSQKKNNTLIEIK